MALTATAQSALPPAPSWDETIVPTLRKRLENESRMLTKRISAVSIASEDDFDFASNSQYYHRAPTNSHTHPHSSQPKPQTNNFRFVPSAQERALAASPTSTGGTKPSGIPRPSLQASRPSISDSRERSTTPTGNGSVISNDSRRSRSKGPAQSTAAQPTTRTRTLSQPKLLDRAAALEQPKKAPTRIPIPRNRAGSASSPNQSPLLQSNGIVSMSDNRTNGSVNGNGYGYSSGNYALEPEDLKSVTLDERDYESRSAAQPRYGNASASAAMQRAKTMDDDGPSRPSTDSEERPFEHWYRGEVARNGGVGELRVGRHLEMLEIANYGHKARAAEVRAGKRASMGRRRAESIGLADRSGVSTVGSRQSFYMEADDSRVERVMDEAPLTDVESDMEGREACKLGRGMPLGFVPPVDVGLAASARS